MESGPKDIKIRNEWKGKHIIFNSDGGISEVKRVEQNKKEMSNNNSNKEDYLDEGMIEEDPIQNLSEAYRKGLLIDEDDWNPVVELSELNSSEKMIKKNQHIRFKDEEELKDDNFIGRNKLYDKYNEYMNEIMDDIDINKNNLLIEQLRNEIDKINYEDEFNMYPEYHNNDFNDKISSNLEFINYRNNLDIVNMEEKCLNSDDNFELDNHQKFLGNFMNCDTPYRSLLVFHGVGTGKTCSAITISNNFRTLENKIIVIVSGTIQPGWFKNLYNIKMGSNQCSGDFFHNMIEKNEDVLYDENSDVIENRIKRNIRKYYEFYGYQKFSNDIKKEVSFHINKKYDKINIIDALKILTYISNNDNQDKLNELLDRYNVTINDIIKVEKEYISQKFSDRLMIVDEVHNLREERESLKGNERDAILYFKKIVKYSHNLRLILMSATPLYNKSTEIISLLNIMLMNDNRPLINERDIFNGEKVTDEGHKILTQKLRGYVSYLRGENPISFPIRLHPKDNKKLIKNTNYEDGKIKSYKFDIYGNKIVKNERIKFLNLYYSELKSNDKNDEPKYIQTDIYNQFCELRLNDGTKMGLDDGSSGIQILNFVFPGSKDINKSYGENGLSQIMTYTKSKTEFKFKKSKLEKYGNIFHKNEIIKYSTKFHSLLNIIKKSDGIIFIYSQYILGCIYPLCIFLEQNGYSNYNNDIFSYDGKEKKNGFNYVVMEGSVNKKKISKMINIINSDENKEGNKIKIIIGSDVTSEGLDFRNIREVHVMEPWYHLFKIEQIIGRAIRRCSHHSLDEEYRNVTIYLHVSKNKTRDFKKKECIDEYIYREAERKAINIGEIEMIMKNNAIDCDLNREINYITSNNIFKKDLIMSNNNIKLKDYDVSDKSYSKICSFMKECHINCDTNISKKLDINYDTFYFDDKKKYIFDNIIKYIRYIFEIKMIYTLDEIEELLYKQIIKKRIKKENLGLGIDFKNDKIILYYTLNKMIKEKTKIWYNGICGTIEYYNKFYLFQPYFNRNKNLSIMNRNHEIKLELKQFINIERSDDKSIELDMIKLSDIYHMIHNKYDELKNEKILNEYKLIDDDKIIYEYIYDFMIIHEKVSLLYHLYYKNFINKDELNKDEKYFFKNIIHNFIYEIDENKYSIKSQKKSDLCIGYFVCNKNNSKKDFIDIYLYDIESKRLRNDNFSKNEDIIQYLMNNKGNINEIILNNNHEYYGYTQKKYNKYYNDDINNKSKMNLRRNNENQIKYFNKKSGSHNFPPGTILDNLKDKNLVIDNIERNNIIRDYLIYSFDKDKDIQNLYRIIKDENEKYLKFWDQKFKKKFNRDISHHLLKKCLETMNEIGINKFNYEIFLKIYLELYMENKFMKYNEITKKELILLINFILRSNDKFIPYDFYLFKFDK